MRVSESAAVLFSMQVEQQVLIVSIAGYFLMAMLLHRFCPWCQGRSRQTILSMTVFFSETGEGHSCYS